MNTEIEIPVPSPGTKLTPGQNLRLWRERMGYSQREAAKKVGCSRGAWAWWESGAHEVPRYISLACSALASGMTPYGEPEPKPAAVDDGGIDGCV